MSRTLVFKNDRHYSSDEWGFVIPVAVEDNEGGFAVARPEDYPNNNKIYIGREFQKIFENFVEGELFALTEVKPNTNFAKNDGPNRCQWVSTGYHSVALPASAYVPIIAMELPDLATGCVGYPPAAYVCNKPFFILNQGAVTGPFVVQKSDDEILVTPYKSSTPLALPKNFVAHFDMAALEGAELVLTTFATGMRRQFLTSLQRAKEKLDYEQLDFTSDTELVKEFADVGFGRGIANLSKAEARKLLAGLSEFRKRHKAIKDNDKTRRLESILDQYLAFEGVGNDVIRNYLQTSEGKAFIERFAQAQKHELLKDFIKDLQDRADDQRAEIGRQTAEIEQKLEDKKNDLKRLEDSFQRRQQEIDEQIRQFNEKLKEEKEKQLREANQQLAAELANRQRIYDELKEAIEECRTVTQRKKALKEMEEKIDELNKVQQYLQQSIDKKQQVYSSINLATDKMVEIDAVKKLLNGVSVTEEQAEIVPVKLVPSALTVSADTRASYIAELKGHFDQTEGRVYSYDEVANLVVTVMQNYLTIFAGPPGTGKTSSAARLADAMGLVTRNKDALQTDNFLTVPVARGWTSSRELLGFYNTLKGCYQPSRSGLYQFLQSFARQAADDPDRVDALKLVLLDEANLSSIEHYWSDFLLICDAFEEGARINLGGTSQLTRLLEIPGSLRFMGTINNDATVEGLSDRLVDRAAVIHLPHGSPSMIRKLHEDVVIGAVPYAELARAFLPAADEDAELDFDEARRLRPITDILSSSSPTIKGGQIHVSYRKLKAIGRYMAIAQKLDYEETEPLDFAIAQHVLPLVKGHGQGLRERLLKLRDKLQENNFAVSRNIVTGILETGVDFSDSYSFF
ncbi:hypothetical protein SAMN04244574_04179 [Azotobacter beijerinckii]|uniref:AAA domain (Dynein-related subfamily) n=2 Tax=Azotobacter beijerinckii TaxID=170623 RepID=A0A1I4HCX1_9GAMM|nr:hypothetical protein SAMN04244574_04179 [Azotobacter beijerinckii]